MTFDELRQFNISDWTFERSSGYAGYRNTITDEWRYSKDYHSMRSKKIQFEEKLKLLHDFRGECLEFGKYPDYVLLEFLKKHFNLI
jgi:hypothetical protein